jgi:hypothetical protein
MAELMIVVLGFACVIDGLEKLSTLNANRDAPHIFGLLTGAAFQTAGSSMAMICVASGDFKLPMVLVLIGMIAWCVSDKREFRRGESK